MPYIANLRRLPFPGGRFFTLWGPPNFPLTQVGLWPTLALVNISDLLTADQAATAAGVNRRTITKWADTGRLPVAMKLPGNTGARLFRRSDVEALTAEATA